MNNDIEVKFFPAQQVVNNNLGNGFIRSGIFSVRFSAWLNPKFEQGYAIKLPTRKIGDEYKDEVSLVNRVASDALYAAVTPHLQHMLGGRTQTQARAPQQQYAPTAVSQKVPPAGTGVPGEDKIPF